MKMEDGILNVAIKRKRRFANVWRKGFTVTVTVVCAIENDRKFKLN